METIKELEAELPEIKRLHGNYEEYATQLDIIQTLKDVKKLIDECEEFLDVELFKEELKSRIDGK